MQKRMVVPNEGAQYICTTAACKANKQSQKKKGVREYVRLEGVKEGTTKQGGNQGHRLEKTLRSHGNGKPFHSTIGAGFKNRRPEASSMFLDKPKLRARMARFCGRSTRQDWGRAGKEILLKLYETAIKRPGTS